MSLLTPMNPDGSCHLDIVKNTVDKLKKIVNSECCLILRSTVPTITSTN